MFSRKDVTDCESKKKLAPNVLTIYIQPTEGFSLSLNGKRNRSRIRHLPVKLDYRNSTEIVENTPEAYEKLLLECFEWGRHQLYSLGRSCSSMAHRRCHPTCLG